MRMNVQVLIFRLKLLKEGETSRLTADCCKEPITTAQTLALKDATRTRRRCSFAVYFGFTFAQREMVETCPSCLFISVVLNIVKRQVVSWISDGRI